jgi:hypothetical protein
MTTDLSVVEQTRLGELEEVIERGIQVFLEVAEALMEVRDGRLYRKTHPTFEDYCSQRWGMSRRRAYQLIDVAEIKATIETAQAMCTVVHTPPTAKLTSERQYRELAPIKNDPEKVMAVLQAAQATGVPITAASIATAVKDVTEPLAPVTAIVPATPPSECQHVHILKLPEPFLELLRVAKHSGITANQINEAILRFYESDDKVKWAA